MAKQSQEQSQGNEKPTRSGYRCQFCGESSPAREWKALRDKCPKCGREYDPITLVDYDS